MNQKSRVRPRLWQRLTALGCVLLLVGFDQLVKRMAQAVLRADGTSVVLIPRVFGLQYVENTGISFSVFGDSAVMMRLVQVLTGALMLAGLALVLAGRVRRGAPLCCTVLILAGGVGNLVDRVLQGYVVDYFEFLFVHFAIFNLADVLIFCGVVWLVLWLLVQESSRTQTAVMP
ncbi:MAG: signal peptidase II [Oscillospiraceae bacterium]|nr:signal peptidase II [Oscillospiraceae bacterium]